MFQRLANARLALGLSLTLGTALAAQKPTTSPPSPTVAILPIELTPQRDTLLARYADSCLAHLARALTAQKIPVIRGSTVEQVRALGTARFGVIGTLKKEGDTYSVELDLIDVASGDELRDYFNSGKTLADITGLADAAAPRILTAIREHQE